MGELELIMLATPLFRVNKKLLRDVEYTPDGWLDHEQLLYPPKIAPFSVRTTVKVGPRWSQAIWKLAASNPSRVALYCKMSLGGGGLLPDLVVRFRGAEDDPVITDEDEDGEEDVNPRVSNGDGGERAFIKEDKGASGGVVTADGDEDRVLKYIGDDGLILYIPVLILLDELAVVGPVTAATAPVPTAETNVDDAVVVTAMGPVDARVPCKAA
ncbi:hypothetical protein BX616_007949 [Lobosporangium transversale]|nr:hypothetical protein BX616_007949 [Lobosporangium transversale]